jgi:hypothetical protein
MYECLEGEEWQSVAYNLSGTLDGLTLLDETIGTEKHNTDLAGFQVHDHTLDTGSEPLMMLSASRSYVM